MDSGAATADGRRRACLIDALATGVAVLLVGLPVHLVLKAHLPHLLGTYWKDALLAILVPLSLAVGMSAERGSWRRLASVLTPLDGAVLLWLLVVLARTVLALLGGMPRGQTLAGAWLTLAALPLYLAVRLLRHYAAHLLPRLVTIVIATGAALGLAALVEGAVIRHPLFPSTQIGAQYGDAAVYVAGTHLLRPYVTFDFPVGLGAYLAAALLLALARLGAARSQRQRALLASAALLSGVGLLLTQSRGPWVGALLGGMGLAALGRRTALGRVMLAAGSLGGLALLGLTWREHNALLAAPLSAISTTAISAEGLSSLPVGVPDGTASLSLLGGAPLVRRHLPASLIVAHPPATPDPAFLRWTIDRVTLPILFEHPPITGDSLLQYRISLPTHPVLLWSIALSPRVWQPTQGDGVTFSLGVGAAPPLHLFFQRYLNPKTRPADRHWFGFAYPLRRLAEPGQTLLLLDLLTNSGPRADARYDWAGWGNPRVVSDAALERRLLAQPAASPPLLTSSSTPPRQVGIYAASVFNWTTDTSNLGRLHAWLASLHAWQRHPLLGWGPGTTDDIATRYRGSAALITESQMLKALVEEGALGLLAWLALLALALPPPATAAPPDQMGAWAVLLALSVAGLVFQVLDVKQVAAVWWVCLGLLPGPAFRARPHLPILLSGPHDVRASPAPPASR